MLQSIRKVTRGAGAYLFVAVVALPLSFFGFSWISSSEGNEQVAKVNGEPIKRRDLLRRTYIERQRELLRQGEQADVEALDEKQLQNRALQVLLNDALIRQEAERRELEISNASVDRMIVEEFRQEDGSFSQDMYERVLLQNGYTSSYYKQEIEGRLLRGQLLSFFNTDFATDKQLQRLYPLYLQKRDARYVQFDLADAQERVVLEEREIRARYDRRSNSTDRQGKSTAYFSEAQVVVEYAVIRRSDFYETPDEEVLRENYQNEINQLLDVYVVAHILLDPASGYSDEEAYGKLEALRQRVLAGEDFAELAREHSEDMLSAANGGYLGEASVSAVSEDVEVGFPPSFREALFPLQRGELSMPVQTQFGWHLIRREEMPVFLPYEKRRAAIFQAVRHANAQDAYFNYLPEIADLLPVTEDLRSLPWQNSEEIIVEGPFSRAEAKGYFAREDMLKFLFGAAFWREGRPVLLPWSDEESLVIYPREYIEARKLSYEEAAERIARELRAEKARRLVRTLAREWRAKVESGESSLAELALQEGRQLFEIPGLERTDTDLPQRVRDTIFSMGYPDEKVQMRVADLGKNGVALVELQAVHPPGEETLKEPDARREFAQLERQLRGRLAAQLFLGTLQLRTVVSDVRLD